MSKPAWKRGEQRTAAQIRASAHAAAGLGDLVTADQLHDQADQLEQQEKARPATDRMP